MVNGDFGSTGRITGLAFYDASGRDITGAVTYRFANGTRVYPLSPGAPGAPGAPGVPDTTVPEPSTYALVGAGLAGVGAARRRRG